MKHYVEHFKNWYESRDAREKILVLGLGCAFIYALFSIFLFSSVDKQSTTMHAEISEKHQQLQNWQTQLTALEKIPQTPLYHEWLKHRTSLETLHKEYQQYRQESPSKQWANTIKTILATHPRVTLVEIKNSPETAFQPNNASPVSQKLYQQQLSVIVYSNYYDTINYLQHLEKALPHIRWGKLSYEVVQYPIAKVQMEFSIVYDKTSN